MPLYFFLSGLFFKDYGGFSRTIIRKFDRLIVPFFFFFAISAIYYLITRTISSSSIHLYDFIRQDGRIMPIGLWFFPCLFFQALIMFMITQLSSHNTFQLFLVLTVALTGIILDKFNLSLPLHIDCSLTYLPFYFFGFAAKKSGLIFKVRTYLHDIIIAIILLFIGLIVGYLNHFQSCFYFENSNNGLMIYNYLEGLLLVLSILHFTKIIKKLPLISYIGRYSIILLGIHFIPISMYTLLCENTGLDYHPIVAFIISVAVCTALIRPLTSHFPQFTAQQNLFSRSF